jgi:endonuclease/exonuclease/phosphatase family metal-dependent hydrolase
LQCGGSKLINPGVAHEAFPRDEPVMCVKFSAMTFNMQFAQRWDSHEPDMAPIHLPATIAFLRKHPHDIYLLQEVEKARPGGEQCQPPPNFNALKSALPGYHSVFAYPKVNPDELPFGIALAIFSRWPITAFEAVDLPPAQVPFEFEGERKQPSHRQLLKAKTMIAGRELTLFNTHLQAFFMIDASSNDHREQRDLVESSLRQADGPALLGGDFNCAPGEAIVEQFDHAGFKTAQNETITWQRRPYVTDHLFFNQGLIPSGCNVIKTDCSDHYPVSCNFTFAR